MSLRLIEVHQKSGMSEEIEFLLRDFHILNMWHYQPQEGETVTRILLTAENTESILDTLQAYFKEEDTRIVILPVEATIPRPDKTDEEKKEETEKKKKEKTSGRISIEELYQKMTGVAGITKKYIVMAVLASFVAAIGLLKNDVAVIIGSMVIAPLLIPNMALSLATTLADSKLARKAMRTNIAGFIIVFFIGLIMGFIMGVDPSIPQITARSDVSHYYIFLALAAGVAGAYSITTGVSEALVGVMVAVALLPPLVASGLLFGAGYSLEGIGAILLFGVNFVCVNLSGVVTFLLQGIQPKEWFEAEKARKYVKIAVAVWIILLFLIAGLILFNQKIKGG